MKQRQSKGSNPSTDANEENIICDDGSIANDKSDETSFDSSDINSSSDNNTSTENTQTDECEDLKKELSALKDSNLRIMAEFDNFRKRSQKEKEQLYPIIVSDTVKKILPFFDNLERALSAETTDENYKTGFTMIFNQFSDVLKDMGVTEIDALGKPFDPELHNAVIMVDDDSMESNMVAEVLQKGYQYDGKVVRHAVVKVTN